MHLFAPLSTEMSRALEDIPALVDKTFPLPGRFRSGLPKDIAELSRLLTSDRGERELSYLGRPNLLSAYLRYFLPWNIFRLARLLPCLDISLTPGDTVLDLGAGPASFAAALWMTRPDLRRVPLELRCVDRTAAVLEAGKKFFTALAGAGSPWKIVTIRGTIGPRGTLSAALRGKPAALVCAVNVFNEIYGEACPGIDGPAQAAGHSARLLDSLAAASAPVLVAEPGVPRSGEFLSCLRSVLIERNRFPLSPCPHTGGCPFPGGASAAGKKRWCHFAFETDDAPAALRKLSAAAGIPKEGAVLSFLYAAPKAPRFSPENQTDKKQFENPAAGPVRIISDAFPLPEEKFGRYACSGQGLVLLAGKKFEIEKISSGMLLNVLPSQQRDPKSGALIAEASSAESLGPV
jgi:hypothetical protein